MGWQSLKNIYSSINWNFEGAGGTNVYCISIWVSLRILFKLSELTLAVNAHRFALGGNRVFKRTWLRRTITIFGWNSSQHRLCFSSELVDGSIIVILLCNLKFSCFLFRSHFSRSMIFTFSAIAECRAVSAIFISVWNLRISVEINRIVFDGWKISLTCLDFNRAHSVQQIFNFGLELSVSFT